jgi:glycerophosphoryl diester phosphodiesterase
VVAPPLVVAHRGASGRCPEHSEAAFVGAVADGADVLEVDVVSSADGVLVARHGWRLTRTTDVEDHPPLLHGRTRRDGHQGLLDDYWVDLLSWEELQVVRCRERWPDLRPASAAADGRWPLMSLVEVLRLAGSQARARDRPVGVAVERKDVRPAQRRRGLDVLTLLHRAFEAGGTPSAHVPVWLMAFEPDVLEELRRRQARGQTARTSLVQLVEASPPQGPEAWDAIAARADVVGIAHDLVLTSAGATDGPRVLGEALARGRQVWTWTLRAENAFLPAALRRGRGPASPGAMDVMVAEAVQVGVTGLIGDQPALLRRLLSVVC